MEIKAKYLDSDGRLFNCNNGTVNLRTGELRRHDRADRISKITAVRNNIMQTLQGGAA
jgi:putative DNA primase/helicase